MLIHHYTNSESLLKQYAPNAQLMESYLKQYVQMK